MKKFLLSIFCLFGIMNYAVADEAVFDFTAPAGLTPSVTDEMFSETTTEGAFEFAISETTFTKNGVTLKTTDGSTASRIWKAASGKYDLRLYKTATMTITAPNGGTITSIAFTGNPVNDFSADNGTVDGKNWTGSASKVVFTWSGSAKTQKINNITVTYSTTGGTVTPDTDEDEEEVVENITIEEVLEAGAGNAKTQGTVIATYARGFLLNDGTGSILVFQGTTPAVSVAEGDVVTVEGTTSMYGGLLQFGNSSVVTKTGTATVSRPTATAMDGAAMDAYLAAPEVKYVEYTGTLTISGNYYNVAVEGAATAIGSIQYPNTGLVTAASGDVVKVTGYTIGVSSSKYVNTMAVSVEVVEDDNNDGDEEEEEVEIITIEEVLDAGVGNAKTQGTILATYARGFLLDDGTGSILVYLGSDNGHTVGDIVTVEGTTSMYGGLLQFGNTSVVNKIMSTTVKYPKATAMDGAAMDAYLTAPEVKYVEYTGTLTISGNYYNVAVEGAATAIGSIQYPNTGLVTAASGDVVKVTGYTIGVSSSKYVNTMAVSVEVISENEEVETVCTVSEALAAYVEGEKITATVIGYIIGAMNPTGYVPEFGDATAVNTNILLSDNADEDNIENCIIVQLPAGAIRTELNLADNKDNFKKQIKITGSIEKYFQAAGLKSPTAYEFTGVTGIKDICTENGETIIYDLTGRRIETITTSGIYIVNGKKAFIK